jgi:hypothetical protein
MFDLILTSETRSLFGENKEPSNTLKLEVEFPPRDNRTHVVVIFHGYKPDCLLMETPFCLPGEVVDPEEIDPDTPQ